jgi:hypothetical protein
MPLSQWAVLAAWEWQILCSSSRALASKISEAVSVVIAKSLLCDHRLVHLTD